MRLAAIRPNPTEQRPKEYPIYPQNCGKLSEIGVFWTLEEVEKIVKEIIETEKITAVFRKTAIILSDNSIDITKKVVDKLNKNLSSVTIKVTP